MKAERYLTDVIKLALGSIVVVGRRLTFDDQWVIGVSTAKCWTKLTLRPRAPWAPAMINLLTECIIQLVLAPPPYHAAYLTQSTQLIKALIYR